MAFRHSWLRWPVPPHRRHVLRVPVLPDWSFASSINPLLCSSSFAEAPSAATAATPASALAYGSYLMTFFHTELVCRVELVIIRLSCGMRTRPAVAGMVGGGGVGGWTKGTARLLFARGETRRLSRCATLARGEGGDAGVANNVHTRFCLSLSPVDNLRFSDTDRLPNTLNMNYSTLTSQAYAEGAVYAPHSSSIAASRRTNQVEIDKPRAQHSASAQPAAPPEVIKTYILLPLLSDKVCIPDRELVKEAKRKRYANPAQTHGPEGLCSFQQATTNGISMYNSALKLVTRTAWQDWSTDARTERFLNAGDTARGI